MESELGHWFAQYLSARAALGRGESRPGDVVPYYGVPFLLTTDDVIVSLGTVDEVAAWLQSQADAMSAAVTSHTVPHRHAGVALTLMPHWVSAHRHDQPAA